MSQWLYSHDDTLFNLAVFSSFTVRRYPLNGDAQTWEVTGFRTDTQTYVPVFVTDSEAQAREALDQMALTLDAIDTETM